MKEMLFIMVAVLVPPTLTFMGVVGDSPAPRAELTWHAPAPANTSLLPAASQYSEASALQPCRPEAIAQPSQQQLTY